MTDFRSREFPSPLGIGKPNIGEPISDKYKVRASAEADRLPPELARFTRRVKPKDTSLAEKLDLYEH